MEKNILILNGSPRKNGNTAALINAFKEGALSNNHHIEQFDVTGMDIHGCLGCKRAVKGSETPCRQHDDMDRIYPAFKSADIVVFASPVYFWTISGPLKTTVDRLYAVLESEGYSAFKKDCVLLTTADGSDYSQIKHWYETFERNLGWNNLGEVTGKSKTSQAQKLGASL